MYMPNTWSADDLITAKKLNNIEQGISDNEVGAITDEEIDSIMSIALGSTSTVASPSVLSFNGRTGSVVSEKGDYTAEMVGALPILGGDVANSVGVHGNFIFRDTGPVGHDAWLAVDYDHLLLYGINQISFENGKRVLTTDDAVSTGGVSAEQVNQVVKSALAENSEYTNSQVAQCKMQEEYIIKLCTELSQKILELSRRVEILEQNL